MNDSLMQDLKKNLKCLEAAGCLFKTEFYQYYFFFYIHKTFPISLMCHVLKTLGFLCNSINVSSYRPYLVSEYILYILSREG